MERAAAPRAGVASGRLALLAAGAPRHSDLFAALDGATSAHTDLGAADVLRLHSLLDAPGGSGGDGGDGGDGNGGNGGGGGATDAAAVEARAARGCVRHGVLLRRLAAAVFSPINPVPYGYRAQYVAVLAHASAVLPCTDGECVRHGVGDEWRARVGALSARLSSAQRICADNPVGTELSAGCAALVRLSEGYPVVGAGVIEWVRANLLDARLASSRYNMASLSSILPLLDQIAAHTPRLRPHAAAVLVDAFAHEPRADDLEASARLAVKRRLLDSLLHALLLGEALPVLACMRASAPTVDLALLRYFVTELGAMASPPYASRFLRAVVDLLAHRRVEEALRSAEPHTQRAVVDLIGAAHAALDGALDEQCIELHDALLARLAAAGAT